jgi:hypothetical protein
MSDNKLIENKQVLNEWVVGGFIMIGLTALTIWALRKINTVKVIGKDGTSGLSAEVYNAIPNLYTDKEFVNDFVKILQKESNLEDIIEKSQTEWYAYKNKNRTGPKYRNTSYDQEDYQDVIKGNIKGYGFQPDAKRIAQNVIKSNGYKKFSKKHKFKAGDDKDMVGVIYYIVTRNDFAETAKKYLYTAASDNKNITIPPLPKDAFDRPSRG